MMPIYVLKKYSGITVKEAEELEILQDDFITEQDLESFGLLRKAVVEDMAEAGKAGDFERVEYLDELYQQMLNIEDQLASTFHQNYMLE